ncbi:MAG: DUF1934 domain-containing protein [Oscillospiraceae bacterium]|nr:DUF1934 domain-containing protein [Oscillospiraceae bacterium]
MKKEVLITVRGTQEGENGPETVELMTRGTMTGRNGKFAISYEETELTGTAGVISTFLVLNPERVVLTRQGTIKSRMVFVKGVRDESLYDLGFGALLLGVFTRDIQVELSDDGGRLFIDYVVEIEQSYANHNSYEVLIKPIHTEEKVP